MSKKLNELSKVELLNTITAAVEELTSRENAVTKYVAREIPSIVDGVETIEHDGKLLRKVDRGCKTGDWVRFSGEHARDITFGKFYEVFQADGWFRDDTEELRFVRSTVNVNNLDCEVFEVVGNVGYIHHVSNDKPLTANQQRVELIQQAREFVDGQEEFYRFDFVVNEKKRTVVALIKLSTGSVVMRGIAICMPGDVFNADIGKAIALAKALQIEIPQEFMNAVQPDDYVTGMVIEFHLDGKKTERINKIVGNEIYSDLDCRFSFILSDRETLYPDDGADTPKILDDTNAEYEFESVGV